MFVSAGRPGVKVIMIFFAPDVAAKLRLWCTVLARSFESSSPKIACCT